MEEFMKDIGYIILNMGLELLFFLIKPNLLDFSIKQTKLMGYLQ
jgi:hypothetical protein